MVRLGKKRGISPFLSLQILTASFMMLEVEEETVVETVVVVVATAEGMRRPNPATSYIGDQAVPKGVTSIFRAAGTTGSPSREVIHYCIATPLNPSLTLPIN